MGKQFRIEFTEDCIYRLTVEAETKEEALEKFHNSESETWDCRNSEISVHMVYELKQGDE